MFVCIFNKEGSFTFKFVFNRKVISQICVSIRQNVELIKLILVISTYQKELVSNYRSEDTLSAKKQKKKKGDLVYTIYHEFITI